jgi:hypothetical protein
MATFKHQLIISLGPELQDSLEEPTIGSMGLDGQEIFLWVCGQIGKLTPADLRELQHELRIPFTTPKSFEREIAAFKSAAVCLSDSGAPLTDMDLYLVLLTKAQNLPILLAVLHTFGDDKEVIHIRDCLSTITEKYSRRVEMQTASTDSRATVAAVADSSYHAKERSDNKGKKRNKSEATKTDQQRPEKFCWFHTHKGRQTSHTSSECKTMLGQPLRYTKEMRSSKSYDECPYKEV